VRRAERFKSKTFLEVEEKRKKGFISMVPQKKEKKKKEKKKKEEQTNEGEGRGRGRRGKRRKGKKKRRREEEGEEEGEGKKEERKKSKKSLYRIVLYCWLRVTVSIHLGREQTNLNLGVSVCALQ
jgi:hypothetical protein